MGGEVINQQAPPPLIASAVSNAEGSARVEAAFGVVEFTTISGITGERAPNIAVRVGLIGDERLVYAEDPSGEHLPVASPLRGSSTVRQLIMPPNRGVNITTAQGTVDTSVLEPLGLLNEDAVRARLLNAGSEGVLIYEYNPLQPLALTRAELEAYATPWGNVTVLRAPAEPADAPLGLLIVSIAQDEMVDYSHITVDRYLAGRIGQAPITDLSADLNYGWAYPVFQIFPADDTITLEGADEATLLVNWRSRFPDPPPPWTFFITTSDEHTGRLTIEPTNFSLGPDSPPQEIVIRVDRAGLPPGAYTAPIFITPFSEAFGTIDTQSVEKTLSYAVLSSPPTPTLGPQADLTVLPDNPREGDLLRVQAAGFTPGEAVLFEFTGNERNIRDGLPIADADGNFSYDLDLTTIPQGDYLLRLTGTNSGVVAQSDISVLEGVADAIVNNPVLNLRTQPACDAPVLEVLADGDEMEIINVNNDDTWVKVVTTSGIEGWVVTRFLRVNIDLADIEWDSTSVQSGESDQSCT